MLSPSKLTKVLNISYLQVLNISYLRRYSLLNKLIILQYIIIWYSAYSRICTVQKIFDCKKCHTHLVSFIRHHGLFVPYIDTFEGTKVPSKVSFLTVKNVTLTCYRLSNITVYSFHDLFLS